MFPSLRRPDVKQSRYVRSLVGRSEVRRSQPDGGGTRSNSRKEEYTLESLSWHGVEDTPVCALIPGIARIAARNRVKLVVVAAELSATEHTRERGHKVNMFLVKLTANVLS